MEEQTKRAEEVQPSHSHCYKADPYSAFVHDFERAYHLARFNHLQMSQSEYDTIMAVANLLISLDPAVDAMLDTSSL